MKTNSIQKVLPFLPVIGGKIETKFDNVVKVIMVLGFGLIPFAHIDMSYSIYFAHRALLNLTAIACAYVFLTSQAHSKKQKTVYIGVISYLFLSSCLAAFAFKDTAAIKEFLSIFTVISLVVYLASSYSRKALYACIGIILFYCLDSIFQSFTGFDFFMFPKHHNSRAWGAFIMGSPSFGVFLMAFFFLPFLTIKKRSRQFPVILILLVALAVANDRAPFLQIPLAMLIFFPATSTFKAFFIAISAVLTQLIFLYFDRFLPYRVSILIETFSTIIKHPELLYQNSYLSLDGYTGIWISNITTWYKHAPFFNKLFGFGWGGGPLFLIEMNQNPRNHQIYMDLLFNLGILGLIILSYALFKLYRKLGIHCLILSTTILPFTFFSLHTFTWLYLTGVAFVFSFWSKALSVESSSPK